MSEHAAPAEPQVHAAAPATGNPVASPEFDVREVATFGKDDGHAVTVIGKMLVGFFFYSLLVMIAVAWWTMGRGGQVDSHAAATEHAEDSEE